LSCPFVNFLRLSVNFSLLSLWVNPPPVFQSSMVFIGKVLLGFHTSPSTFPFLSFSFFFKFWFFLFFYIFESKQYQRWLNKKKSVIVKFTR
jgi:hypothetical protein